MLRKTLLAFGAAVAIGTAALTPTAASAHWHGGWGWGWHHHHYSFGFYPAYYGGNCHVVRRVVGTPWGPRLRRFAVCD